MASNNWYTYFTSLEDNFYGYIYITVCALLWIQNVLIFIKEENNLTFTKQANKRYIESCVLRWLKATVNMGFTYKNGPKVSGTLNLIISSLLFYVTSPCFSPPGVQWRVSAFPFIQGNLHAEFLLSCWKWDRDAAKGEYGRITFPKINWGR